MNYDHWYLYANYLYTRLILSFRFFGTSCCDGKLISILKKNFKFWKDRSLYYNFIKFIFEEKDFLLEKFKIELLKIKKENGDLCPDCSICYKKKAGEREAILKIEKFKMFFDTLVPEPNICIEKFTHEQWLWKIYYKIQFI